MAKNIFETTPVGVAVNKRFTLVCNRMSSARDTLVCDISALKVTPKTYTAPTD